jgi:hypothetical protein
MLENGGAVVGNMSLKLNCEFSALLTMSVK